MGNGLCLVVCIEKIDRCAVLKFCCFVRHMESSL